MFWVVFSLVIIFTNVGIIFHSIAKRLQVDHFYFTANVFYERSGVSWSTAFLFYLFQGSLIWSTSDLTTKTIFVSILVLFFGICVYEWSRMSSESTLLAKSNKHEEETASTQEK